MVKPLTPQQMVEPRAFAPFEIVEVMKEWHERWIAACLEANLRGMPGSQYSAFHREAAGFGAPSQSPNETAEEFGLRVATAIFTLIKEI